MNSKAKDYADGQRLLQAMPEEAKQCLEHVVSNAAAIIRGLAEQIRLSPDNVEANEVRARVITETVDDLIREKREMLYAGDGRLGAVESV